MLNAFKKELKDLEITLEPAEPRGEWFRVTLKALMAGLKILFYGLRAVGWQLQSVGR